MGNPAFNEGRPSRDATLTAEAHYRAVCGKCGARRVDAQIGLEPDPDAYVAALVAVFREVRRVLRNDGCAWVNIGDGYAANRSYQVTDNKHRDVGNNGAMSVPDGLKPKDLLMMPARVALALQADGWWLRSMIPWLKRSAMPSSATDRPTTATEYVFLLSKRAHYFYDTTAVAVPSVSDHGSGNGYKRPQQLSRGGRGSDAPWSPQATRYRRDADWWFDSLHAILAGATGLLADEDGEPLALPVNPAAYPGAHFATFSPKLVEPMVLASTSARGCCGKCGAPWVRTTERGERAGIPGEGGAGYVLPKAQASAGDGRVKGRSEGWIPNHFYPQETTGWRAGCACDAGDPIPCTALDPFCGAGTVSLVARKHGRQSIGVDLSAAYLEMARERLGQLALPLMGG